MTDIATFQTNDLKTLTILVPQPGMLRSTQLYTSTLWNCIQPRLKKLDISLKLPLSAYDAIEKANSSPTLNHRRWVLQLLRGQNFAPPLNV